MNYLFKKMIHLNLSIYIYFQIFRILYKFEAKLYIPSFLSDKFIERYFSKNKILQRGSTMTFTRQNWGVNPGKVSFCHEHLELFVSLETRQKEKVKVMRSSSSCYCTHFVRSKFIRLQIRKFNKRNYEKECIF